jgi:hypothetical protein
MHHTEIPHEEWQTFCDQFTRQHHAWIVNLSVSDSDVGLAAGIAAKEAEQRMRPISRSAAFHSIVIESFDGRDTVAIVVGPPPGQVACWIDDPRHLFFRQTEDGAHEGLAIESALGETTLLRFRAAALPEDLDGMAAVEFELSGCGTG